MTKFDELTEGLEFPPTAEDISQFVTPEKKEQMTKFFDRWHSIKHLHLSVEGALHKFSNEEIKAYALWRTMVYDINNPPLASHLRTKIFMAVLERFTNHYLSLAGRDLHV